MKQPKFTKVTSKDLFETPQELIDAMFNQYRVAYDKYKRNGETKMLDAAIEVVLHMSHFLNYVETVAALREHYPQAFEYICWLHNSIMSMKNDEPVFALHNAEFEKFRDFIDIKQ